MIILDRKLKRKHHDKDWSDPFGLEDARKSKQNEIPVEAKSDNPVYKFLETWQIPKLLLGKTAYVMKFDKTVKSGKIADVYPPDMLHIKDVGVFFFKDVISLGD